MLKEKLQKNKGFVLLYAVTLSAILLAVAIGVANIALKEIKFGTSAKDTNNSFFAADTGIECALVNDKSSSSLFVNSTSPSITCNNNTFTATESPTAFWTFNISNLGSTGLACARVTVDKTNSPATTIISKGYNIGSSDGNCTSTNPNRVEREVKTIYGGIVNASQTPLRTLTNNVLSSGSTDFNLGYKFTPTKNGTITQLAFRTGDNLSHYVRLYDSNGIVLASSVNNGAYLNWVVSDITPVNVTAGNSYIVAVRTSTYYYENLNSVPQTTGDIVINGTSSISGSDSVPNNFSYSGLIFGETDITFVPN